MNLKASKKNGKREKLSILEREILSMLRNENPLKGIYGMYGDHPHTPDTNKKRGRK